MRVELNKVYAFEWLTRLLAKMAQLERDFYAVQTSAIRAIPRALAELDVRLQHALAEALPHEPRLAHTGIPAPAPRPTRAHQPARAPAMQASRWGNNEEPNRPSTHRLCTGADAANSSMPSKPCRQRSPQGHQRKLRG